MLLRLHVLTRFRQLRTLPKQKHWGLMLVRHGPSKFLRMLSEPRLTRPFGHRKHPIPRQPPHARQLRTALQHRLKRYGVDALVDLKL